MKFAPPHQMSFIWFCIVNLIVLQEPASCQTIQRQMVSAQGGIYKGSKGVIFSQTIGQLSVIGTTSTPNHTFQQGFQQSFSSILESKISIADFSVIVYPNPFVESFTILVSSVSDQEMAIRVTSILGQLIYQGNMLPLQTQKTIPFGSYPSGTYLVQLYSKNQIISKKIIKN